MFCLIFLIKLKKLTLNIEKGIAQKFSFFWKFEPDLLARYSLYIYCFQNSKFYKKCMAHHPAILQFWMIDVFLIVQRAKNQVDY